MTSYIDVECVAEAVGARKETGMRAGPRAHFWDASNLRDSDAEQLQRRGCLPRFPRYC